MDETTTGLARRLEEVLGEPHARALMDGLTFAPDEELARRSDIHGVNQRIDGLEQRMDGLEQRMDGLEQRMDGLEQRMELMEQRLLMQVHKEMITQTRFFAVTMAAVVVAALGFVAAVL